MRNLILRTDSFVRRRVRALLAMRPKPTIQEKYPQFEIGRGTYGIPLIRSWNEGPVLRIGNFCSIAARVQILLGGEHRVDWVTTYPFSVFWPSASGVEGHPRIRGDVVIGNDVWLGTEATIMSGVTIGDGAVVGAKAVVTRDVPPYAVVAGNPARLVRFRFSDDEIERLLALRWWDWGDERIGEFLPLLLSTDVVRFLDAAADVEL
jgi:acetyltransferase-like isoleucine patch superfamily enzyme